MVAQLCGVGGWWCGYGWGVVSCWSKLMVSCDDDGGMAMVVNIDLYSYPRVIIM